jgi:hypothetical protein
VILSAVWRKYYPRCNRISDRALSSRLSKAADEGDTARGEWVIMVQIKQRALAGKEMLVRRYIDEFVRTPEGWRISSVKFVEEGIYPQVDFTSQPVTEPYLFR